MLSPPSLASSHGLAAACQAGPCQAGTSNIQHVDVRSFLETREKLDIFQCLLPDTHPRQLPQTVSWGLRIRTMPEAADGLEKKTLDSRGDLPTLLLGSMWRKHLREGAARLRG